MPGDRRTADRKPPRDLTGGQLPRAQLLQDLPACGVRQRPEDARLRLRPDLRHRLMFSTEAKERTTSRKRASGGRVCGAAEEDVTQLVVREQQTRDRGPPSY